MKMLLFFVLALLTLPASAKIWIVDSNPGSTAKDFVTLNAAYMGAAAGDTLYLIGSPNNYLTTKIIISKRLIIIGPGYFLSQNPDTQVSLAGAHLFNSGTCTETLEFAAGSEGSVLMGLTNAGMIRITTSNILIKRNYFTDGQPGCSQERIILSGSNCIIVQNFIDGPSQGQGITVSAGYSGIAISNNYIFNHLNSGNSAIYALNGVGSVMEISNNVFAGGVNVNNSTVQNNIFITANNVTAPGSIVRNNAHVSNLLPGGSGNIINIPLGNLIVGSGSTDGQFKLAVGSPAIGAGFGGVDCGMFGGPEPYVLSGIPPIPSIYSLTAPAIGEKNTGLPITIKIKSNN